MMMLRKKDFWLKTLYDKFLALKQTTICSFVELNLGKEIIWGYMGYVLRKKMINVNDLLDFFDKIKMIVFWWMITGLLDIVVIN